MTKVSVYQAAEEAIDQWQIDGHWYGDALPSHSIAAAVVDALLASRVPTPCPGVDGYCGPHDGEFGGTDPCPECNGEPLPPRPLVVLYDDLEQVGVADEFFPEPNYRGRISHGQPVFVHKESEARYDDLEPTRWTLDGCTGDESPRMICFPDERPLFQHKESEAP